MLILLTVTYWQQFGTNQERPVSVNAAVQHTTLYGRGDVGFVRNRGGGKCSESTPRRKQG